MPNARPDRRTSVGAFALFLLLAIVHTWPLATAPGRLSLNHNADAQQTAWTLSWIARTLPRDPLNLFNANIFAPERNTLAYSDPLIAPALVVAPVRWLGGSAVLTFNLALLAGLTLTGWATWLAARRWTASTWAALVAGSLAAFNPHVLTRLPHLAAAFAWTVPLSLVLADGLIDTPRRSRAWALALVVAATAATSLYSLALVGLIVGVVITVGIATRRVRGSIVLAVASVGGLVLALPVLWPYAAFGAAGIARPLESVGQFSATLSGYLASTSRVHHAWSAPFFERDVSVFFAGFTAIVLATVGLFAPASVPHLLRRRVIVLAMAAVGLILSLGPLTSVYVWLYEWVAPIRALRAAARFGYLYLVAVAFAAAFGVAWLEGRLTTRRARATLAVVAVVLVNVEAWSAPIYTWPFAGVPPIYSHLRTAPDPVLLVELPFYPAAMISEGAEYELNSTAHFRPLLNGASGYTPNSYRERADAYWFFPEERAFDAMRRDRVTHVMVHLERFSPQERLDIDIALRAQSLLQLVATDSQGHRLYRVK